jgi:hypothetical protein
MMIDGVIATSDLLAQRDATSDLLAQRDRMWPVAIYWRFNVVA